MREPRKPAHYRRLAAQLRTLLGAERDPVANAANAAAFLFHELPDVHWAGFYFLRGDDLVLGPFLGKPACSRIAVGTGVCGTSAAHRQTIVVEDVRRFSGHIACDPASRSEIVVPLIREGRLLGVLDLDSPTPARFDHEDRAGLETLARVFVEATSFSGQDA